MTKNLIYEKKDDKIKNPLSPIKRSVHLLLREYCLRKTRERGRLVTLGETVEKAILNLIEQDKGD